MNAFASAALVGATTSDLAVIAIVGEELFTDARKRVAVHILIWRIAIGPHCGRDRHRCGYPLRLVIMQRESHLLKLSAIATRQNRHSIERHRQPQELLQFVR